jgi:hypothetical protein
MGQYGNQPDFGTRAGMIMPTGDAQAPQNGQEILKSAALYIGTGGDLWVNVVGGNNYDDLENATLFKNIPDGTFFPVIVTNVWATNDEISTTCADIVALY